MAVGQNQVIYQAHPNTVQSVKDFRDQMHRVGQQYVNRNVQVQTIDGITYEGRLVHLDGGLLFLSLPSPSGHEQWDEHEQWHDHGHGHEHHEEHHDGHHDGHPWNWDGHSSHYGYQQQRGLSGAAYYNNVILPLVLYELLVITLML